MSAILHGVADIHKLKMCKFTPDALFSACTFTVFGQRDATYKKSSVKKELFTGRFFKEPKMVLIWHHCRNPLLDLHFSECIS